MTCRSMLTIAEDDVTVVQGVIELCFVNPMNPHFVLGPLVDDKFNYRHLGPLASLDGLGECTTYRTPHDERWRS
jgi:hypothetical protein